jgi:hypothetical protein
MTAADIICPGDEGERRVPSEKRKPQAAVQQGFGPDPVL